MRAMTDASPDLEIVRRVITRPADLGGEDYEAVTEDQFRSRHAAGGFCIDWRAHGLRYGIPAEVRLRVGKGEQLLVNLSREVLVDVQTVFTRFVVLNVTARPETLAARLMARGRESAAEIDSRLRRTVRPLPPGLTVFTVANDGPIEDTVDAALACLNPVRA